MRTSTQNTMPFLLVLPLLSLILGALALDTAEAATGEPVALAHSCLRVSIGDHGKKDHGAIILLHGITGLKESWMGIYQLLALRTGRRVCIVDLRNHGESPWNNETDIGTMAEDLSLLLDTIKEKKVILLGHSLGGKIALHFALNNPNKVEKLIVEDMRPNSIAPVAEASVKYFIQVLQNAITSVPKEATESEAKEAIVIFLNAHRKRVKADLLPPAYIHHLLNCSGGNCQWKANLQLFREVLEDMPSVFTKSTGKFDGPTLFVYGSESPFKVAEAEKEIMELFSNAKLVEVKGADHFVHLKPEFNNVVIRFINEK